jgi:hypothetical protein
MTWHAEAEKEVRVGEYRRRSPEYMPVSRTSPKSVPVDALIVTWPSIRGWVSGNRHMFVTLSESEGAGLSTGGLKGRAC